MATPVVMPQMGESIAEGTIVRWIKKVGDAVERDEPLFEISTDKVDAEIPAPAAGVLTDIKVHEGETVAVNSIVATIGQAGEAVAAPAPKQQPDGQSDPIDKTAAVPSPPAISTAATASPTASADTPGPQDHSNNGRHRTSPLVRRIAKDHNVDITQIAGSGIAGRVTKHDI